MLAHSALSYSPNIVKFVMKYHFESGKKIGKVREIIRDFTCLETAQPETITFTTNILNMQKIWNTQINAHHRIKSKTTFNAKKKINQTKNKYTQHRNTRSTKNIPNATNMPNTELYQTHKYTRHKK